MDQIGLLKIIYGSKRFVKNYLSRSNRSFKNYAELDLFVQKKKETI